MTVEDYNKLVSVLEAYKPYIQKGSTLFVEVGIHPIYNISISNEYYMIVHDNSTFNTFNSKKAMLDYYWSLTKPGRIAKSMEMLLND